MDCIKPPEIKSYKDEIYVVLYLATTVPCWWFCFQFVRRISFNINIGSEPLCIFYQALLLTDHVNRLVRSCYYQLHRIKSVRRALPTATAIQLVNSFIISQVDYCNSILAAAPSNQLDRVQSVLTVAARLIYGRGRFERVCDLIRDRLHWLRVPQRFR